MNTWVIGLVVTFGLVAQTQQGDPKGLQKFTWKEGRCTIAFPPGEPKLEKPTSAQQTMTHVVLRKDETTWKIGYFDYPLFEQMGKAGAEQFFDNLRENYFGKLGAKITSEKQL